MQTFRALLFAKRFPPAGAEVVAHFDSLRLNIQSPEGDTIKVDASSLEPRSGGFEHDQLLLYWDEDDNGSQCALKPLRQEDQQTLINNAPDALSGRFKPWRRRKTGIRMVWATLGSLALAGIFAALLFWWNYDHVVAWLAGQIDVKHEVAIGNAMLKHIDEEENHLISDGPAVRAMAQLGERLIHDSQYQYRWFIKRDPSLNAFAVPGGIIVVHSGLFKAIQSPEELSALLAHEIKHVEARHALRSMVHNLIWASALLVILGDSSAVLAVAAHQLGALYYSREIESEADSYAVQTLIDARIYPRGILRLMERLRTEYDGEEAPGWLSSHPAISQRIKQAKELIEANPCPQCQSPVLSMDMAALKRTLPQD